jgi:hypothetical protein
LRMERIGSWKMALVGDLREVREERRQWLWFWTAHM